MLVEIAIGDAYGASFEFAPEKFVETHNSGDLYVAHHSRDIKPGRYTDDTQMSMALVEMILDDVEFTPLNVADKFVEVYKRDPREGYGAIYKLLNDKNVKSGIALLRRIKPFSEKNGSMMRSVPLGIFKDHNRVIETAAIQSMVTHCHPDAIHAAQITALMSHWAIYHWNDGQPMDLFEIMAFMECISPSVKEAFDRLVLSDIESPVPCHAIKTLRAVLGVLHYSSSLKGVLVDSCSLQGDTDSVAAVAMGIACNSHMKKDLPRQLVKGLENGDYGLDYLIDLDSQIKDYMETQNDSKSERLQGKNLKRVSEGV